MSDDATFQRVMEQLDEPFQYLEERLETQEKLLANLMKAYMELNAAVEQTISELMSPRTDEEREQFRHDMNRRHTDMMHTIQEVIREVERSDTKDDATMDLLRMASEKDEASSPDE